MNWLKKILTITIFFIPRAVFCAPFQIDYYGVVSVSSDTKMMKMAQDIFYTQLKSIDNIQVTDKRENLNSVLSDFPHRQNNSNANAAFFVQIIEKHLNENISWECDFIIQTLNDSKTYSKKETFDSYYKILTNAKNSLDELISPLKEKHNSTKSISSFPEKQNSTLNSIDSQNISGIWSGESETDKIVILRGGRGFVIFKNGATMNISIQIENQNNETKVFIKQTGKSNASFYPNLSRETALEAANGAAPIEWIFTLTDEKTLSGIKKTLVPSRIDPNLCEKGTVETVWTKK